MSRMPGQTHKVIDLVGVSQESIDAAIRDALARASETLQGLDWFEVTETRGVVSDGEVTFHVSLRVGIRLSVDPRPAAQAVSYGRP
jgi:flavin-binding protein dodecin